MKAAVLVRCIVIVALLGLSCAPDDGPGISIAEDSLTVSVTEIDDGIIIENLSGVDCIVFGRSPEGEQQFELDVGERVTVTGITKPIELAAVRL